MMHNHALSLDINNHGRDFIVGDIHGMFTDFETILKKVKFNPEIDRVISVGDLIDRGTESPRVLEFIHKPWFFSIMGNHERMCLDAATDSKNHTNWVKHNGGDWWEEVDTKTQNAIVEAFKPLPTIAEISTKNGLIGVVHADISTRVSWSKFKEQIATDKSLRNFALWSRTHYDRYHSIGDKENIQGVKLVVVGHTPVSQCTEIGNIRFIDTGASYTDSKKLAKLTLMQIQPEIKLFQISTKKKKKWSFA